MKIEFKNTDSFENLISTMKKEDEIECPALDFMGQNLKELQERIKALISLGGTVYFVKENLRFSPEKTPQQEMLFHLLEVFKNFEQENILKRRRLGIQKAKEQGKYAKERRKKLPSDLQEALLKDRENGLNVSEIIQKYKISRKTFYNYSKNSTNNILKNIGILLGNDLKVIDFD